MRLARLIALCCLALAACERPAPSGEGVAAALREADTSGFARADAPRPFSFPADHGPHLDFRDEWWYVTGNLDGADGRRFGFQITFFRHGLQHGLPPRPSLWAGQDVYMAHFALTDLAGQRYTSFQRLSRGAAGLAGAQAAPLRVWLDDWQLQAAPDGGFPWQFQAAQDGIALRLALDPRKPPVLNGEQGLSRKNAAPGNASYYYSISRLAAQGTLTLAGQTLPVQGLAWLDREWSTSMLAESQAGWDWFALQLDDGAELMLFRLRRKDGAEDPASSGTWTGADGAARHVSREAFAVDVLDSWDSPAGGRYPARWRLTLKDTGRRLEVRPLLADQEFRHDARYWEGAVDVFDADSGARAGRGYVELTGYAQGVAGKP